MRNLVFSLALVLPLAPASAAEGDLTVSQADVTFAGGTKLYRGTSYTLKYPTDTWYYISFTADVDAELKFDMDAESELTWPEILTQGWTGITNGGVLELTSDLDLALTVGINTTIGGTAVNFAYEIWGLEKDWSGIKSFDSLLLPGTGQQLVRAAIDPDDLFYFESDEYFIYDGNSDGNVDSGDIWVRFAGDIAPSSWAQLRGVSVRTGSAVFENAADTKIIDPPDANDGTVELQSTWEGFVDAAFALLITPELTAGYGSSSVAVPYTYTWTVDTDERSLKSKPVSYDHDIPGVQLSKTSIDLGTVYIGESAEIEVDVRNLGEIELWGSAKVVGDSFSVAQPDISATKTAPDKLTIRFAPTAEGDFAGTLTVTTNDPVKPTVEVPLSGEGVDREANLDDTGAPLDDTGGDVGSAKGCSCTSSPTPASFGFLALGLAALLGRRRR